MADVQMDIYEDMFKEITKKIYGQDAPPPPPQSSEDADDGQFAGQDAYKMVVEEGLSMMDGADGADDAAESSFVEQSPAEPEDDPWVTSDETIAWTTSKIGSYNVEKKLFKCQECDSVGLLSSVAEHWLGTHADVKVFQCPQCPYASAYTKCIRLHLSRHHNVVQADHHGNGGGGGGGGGGGDQAAAKPWNESAVLAEVTGYLGRLKAAADEAVASATAAAVAAATAATATADSDDFEAAAVDDDLQQQPCVQVVQTVGATDTETQTAQKRFNCAHCPYATDRRDLYTRHENIHKEDKPFQCDICQKQFNRADHVKKHYTRMHREHEYCLSKVKRDPYGKLPHQHPKPPSMTLYSGDPPPLEPETQIIVSTGPMDAGTPIITATPLMLHDDHRHHHHHQHQHHHHHHQHQHQHQQQQQTVVNIAVVNFNEQTGTHTIQIPIPASQLKPVMFAPETILSVDSSMIPTGIPEVVQIHRQPSPPAVVMQATAAMTTTTAAAAAAAAAAKSKGKSSRKNAEKRYCCTFCSWSGVDNWCLKRHLNTHMKPYECVFCEYKAARAERLATHVFKVHSKRMCCRCSYIAQDQDDLYAHQSENNHKSVRSRRTQTSPTPSSPDRAEENAEKNDVIVVWPMAAVDSQSSIQI